MRVVSAYTVCVHTRVHGDVCVCTLYSCTHYASLYFMQEVLARALDLGRPDLASYRTLALSQFSNRSLLRKLHIEQT